MHTIKLKPVPASEPAPAFDNLELSLSTDQAPLLPPGEHYEVIVLGIKRTVKFKREVLAFTFKVVSEGTGFGCIIPSFVNLPTGRQLPLRSKLASWMRVIHEYDPSLNLKRLSLKVFSCYQFSASIVTVVTDRNQRPIPARDQFSKIDNLIAVSGRLTV